MLNNIEAETMGKTGEGGDVKVWIILGSMVCSVVVSVVTTKILAIHYFELVDGYVEKMCDMTEKNNRITLATIRKLQRSSDQEE